MPIQISCPTCQRQLRVPDNLVGQLVKCPSCQNTFTASVEEKAPPPREESIREEEPREKSRSAREERYREDDEQRPVRRRSERDDEFDDDRSSRRRGLTPHRGTLILVLGIMGLVGVGSPITGIIAWVLGNTDMQQIRSGKMDPEGESNTNIGRILGMVSTILWGVGGLIFCTCFCLIPLVGRAGR